MLPGISFIILVQVDDFGLLHHAIIMRETIDYVEKEEKKNG